MSVRRANETTFKDNKNAKENILKFSTTTKIQVEDLLHGGSAGSNCTFKEMVEETNVSDFKTEMAKGTEIQSLAVQGKEMLESFHQEAIKTEIVSSTNCQHLQEQFSSRNNNNNNNDSNYSTSSTKTKAAATMESAEMIKTKQITKLDLEKQQPQQQQQTLLAVKESQKSPLYETPSTVCLHIYICETPSASLFQRSPLLWRCCCLCPNTLTICSPLLRDFLCLFCLIFILTFLIYATTYSESYMRHYNAAPGEFSSFK